MGRRAAAEQNSPGTPLDVNRRFALNGRRFSSLWYGNGSTVRTAEWAGFAIAHNKVSVWGLTSATRFARPFMAYSFGRPAQS
jgi:hypothetical protein